MIGTSNSGYLPMEAIPQHFAAHGYVVVPTVLDGAQTASYAARLNEFGNSGAGTRKLLNLPWCVDLACELRERLQIRSLLPEEAVAVQCTLFTKSMEKNWLVALHQDLSIPVAFRVPSLECSGWSEKEGDIFVQPPLSVLQTMVAVRFHVDECKAENGALRVVPDSHTFGQMSPEEAPRARDVSGEITVPVPRGGALVMRPLLLHASSKTESASPRRVLHFVFGPRNLPEGLQWQIAM